MKFCLEFVYRKVLLWKSQTQEHSIGYDGGLYFSHIVDRPIDRFYDMISDKSAGQKNFLPL